MFSTKFFNFSSLIKRQFSCQKCPEKVDVLVIGGGAMGSSSAYWLMERTKRGNLKVLVTEKDPTYKKCSTALSVGGLRQQFSMPENVQMSIFGADFIKNIKRRFGDDADVGFRPNGYLFLASALGAKKLERNYKMQESLGVVHLLLTKRELKERFPWLDIHDLECGCLGFDTEGWFDPWSLLQLLKNGAMDLGTEYISGEVVEFECRDGENGRTVTSTTVKLPNGDLKKIECDCCVLAAGCESGEVAKLAGIGTGEGTLSHCLPVEKRKRYVYNFNCREHPLNLHSPMVIDSSGAYFRREGETYICGRSPTEEEEPSTEDLEVDYEFFDKNIWPALVNRVPAFGGIKVVSAWSGFYEFNTFDQNGIVGRHPYYSNLYIASGFSGHGIQQSAAVGRAISELILDGKYKSIDLTKLGFERIIRNEPTFEIRII